MIVAVAVQEGIDGIDVDVCISRERCNSHPSHRQEKSDQARNSESNSRFSAVAIQCIFSQSANEWQHHQSCPESESLEGQNVEVLFSQQKPRKRCRPAEAKNKCDPKTQQ